MYSFLHQNLSHEKVLFCLLDRHGKQYCCKVLEKILSRCFVKHLDKSCLENIMGFLQGNKTNRLLLYLQDKIIFKEIDILILLIVSFHKHIIKRKSPMLRDGAGYRILVGLRKGPLGESKKTQLINLSSAKTKCDRRRANGRKRYNILRCTERQIKTEPQTELSENQFKALAQPKIH